MLMYLDHLQNWLDNGNGVVIFFCSTPLWLSETGQILGFPGIFWITHGGNGLQFCTLMYLDHLHYWLVYGRGVVVFLICLWSCSVDFFKFWCYFNLVEWVKLGLFLGFSWTHCGNGLQFCMLMYPDHLQNWLDYGHSLLIFGTILT